MVYECEICGTVLRSGVRTCPGCGDVFEQPVPLDAEERTPDAEGPVPGISAANDEPVPDDAPAAPSPPEPEAAPAASPDDWYDAPEPATPARRKSFVWIGLLTVVLLAATVGLLVYVLQTGEQPVHGGARHPIGTSAPSSHGTSSALEGTLVGPPLKAGGREDIVILAHVLEDLQAFTKANVLRNDAHMRKLVRSGRVFTMPSGKNRGREIDSRAPGFIQIRILTGDNKNETEWTYKESLQP